MDRPILDHLLARAQHLAPVADLLETGPRDGVRRWTVQPHRVGAIPVVIGTYADSDAREVYFGEHGEPEELYGAPAVSIEVVDEYVDAALEGRVHLLTGPHRTEIVVTGRDGGETGHVVHEGWRGLIPRPGWRERSVRTDFPPYTTGA